MSAGSDSSISTLQRRIDELEQQLEQTRERLQQATRNHLDAALLNQNVLSLTKETGRLKKRVTYLRAQLDAETSVPIRLPGKAATPAEKTFANALDGGQATYSFRFADTSPRDVAVDDTRNSDSGVSSSTTVVEDRQIFQTEAPHPGEIPGNDWTKFAKHGYTSDFVPERSVSVIIPVYNGQAQLDLTLKFLSYQNYPKDLVEIIVADDGSSPPAKIPELPDLPATKLVAQDDLGFRLAAARNLGAAAATHDILLFLDCDMLPDPQWIARHAYWHHGTDIVVTPGSRRHIESDEVAEFVSRVTANPGQPFADSDWLDNTRAPRWIEEYYATTSDLTDESTEILFVVCGGNMGVSRELFEDVGGFSETFAGWGGEDAELTYRLYSQGAVIVPNTDALCIHQGMDGVAGADADEALEFVHQKVLLHDLIPVPPFRRHGSKTIATRPTLSVTVLASYEPAAQIQMCVGSILQSPLADVVIDLSVPDDHIQRRSLELRYAADPRVDCSGEADFDEFIPYVAVVAPYVMLGEDTLMLMMESLHGNGYGMATAVDETIGQTPGVVMYRQRALQRALLSATSQADIPEVIDRLFGVDSYTFNEIGITLQPDASVMPPYHGPQVNAAREANEPVSASGGLSNRLLSDLGLADAG